MKIIWEASDIRPGRVVGKAGRKEEWMIGYLNGEAKADNFCLISLNDGCVSNRGTAEQLASSLTESNDWPIRLLR